MPDLIDPAEDGLPGTADLRPEAFTWDAPDRSLLSSDFGDAPRFPVDMLGPFWSQWVALSARSANAPVDYTAGTLLATVGAMLGNVCASSAFSKIIGPTPIGLSRSGSR